MKPFRYIAPCLFVLAIALQPVAAGAAQPATDPASPPSPMQQVRTLADQILGLARSPGCKADLEACRKELLDLLEPHWDQTEMARSAMGVHWKDLDAKERKHFTALFAELTEDLYLSRANLSVAENFVKEVKIKYLRETISDDGYGQVYTTVALAGHDKPIDVNYRLRLRGEQWEVYDVIVAGISLVANYRNQFNRVINSKGYPTLVQILQDKVRRAEAAEAIEGSSKH